MKKLLVGLVAVMVAMSSFAAARYFAKSGDFGDSANWVNGETPKSGDGVSLGASWWGSAMRPASVEVYLHGATNQFLSVAVDNQYRAAGDVDTYPVTVYGEGGKFELATSGGKISTGTLRKATYDDVLITHGIGGGSGDNLDGETVFRNGSCVTDVVNTVYMYLGANSQTVLDGSSFYDRYFAPRSGARLIICNGGWLGFQSYYTPEDANHSDRVLARVQARVVDGSVDAGTQSVYTDGFLPERSGTLKAGGFCPTCAADGSSALRLGGTLRLDAGASYQLSATNSFRLYGGGKLFVGIPNCGTHDFAFDLSEFYLKGRPIQGSCTLGDGITFGTLRSSDYAGPGSRTYLTGATTLRSDDAVTGEQRNPNFVNLYCRPGAGVTFSGGGSCTLAPSAFSDRFATFDVGAGMTVYYYATWNEALRTHDFRMAANSVCATREGADYYRSVPCVTGEAQVDPSAVLKVRATKLGQQLFRSIDNVAAPRFEFFNADEVAAKGWGVMNVEGCYYIATNNCFAQGSLAWCAWRGLKGGLWSNASNWQSYVPGKGKANWGAHLTCTYDGGHMVTACLTNDCQDLVLPHLYMLGGAGPHIIRGNAITLTSGLKNTKCTTSYQDAKPPTGSAICSYGTFPLIVEAPIHATGEYFGVVAGGDIYEASVIALKGDITVDNTFAPSGDVVVDGALTAKDLELNPIMSDAVGNSNSSKKWRGTVLTIRNGGEVKITDPTVSQTTGMVWIAKGGSFKVDGDFSWTDASMIHRVDGTLSVAGQLTGTGVETYYGKGKVAFGGIAAGTTAKFGQGVTIAPTTAEASKWTGNVQIDGRVAIAPEEEMTLPSTFTVVRPGSVLDFAGGEFTVLAAAPTGADYDVRVTGKLAIADDLTLPWLTFEPGATLAFAAKANGTIPTLTVNGNVDLTGVRIVGYADEDCAAIRRSTLLAVPEHFRITGTPAADDHYAYAVVDNEEGGQSLVASYKRGLMVILR